MNFNKIRFTVMQVLFLILPIQIFAQATGDYRSAVSGNWSALATWQRYNGITWLTPTIAEGTPTNASGAITILSGNTVTIDLTVTIDQTVVDPGAFLQTSGAFVLTINDGPGVDLAVNGTFTDGSSGSVTAGAGSPTWLIGASGKLIRTTGSAATFWQSNYSGGISTIPASADWILRKTTAANPVITTVGAYYPNLIIENNVAGMWTTVTTSTFQGNSGFPTIKGNFDVGGAGSSTVDFLNQHTFGTATLVLGNTNVRAGSILSNYGTGIELQGNLSVDGTVQYDASDPRRIIFSGGNAQTISGSGTINIWDLTMSKSANNVTLNKPITIDNLVTFTTGNIISSSANLLILAGTASLSGVSNSSFADGPVRKLGNTPFTYPVGKNGRYRMIGQGIGGPGSNVTFWTEAFQNGCSRYCLASSYSGPNGAWSIASAGSNGTYANTWYVSGMECGNAAGVCGSGCGTTDPSLHVGNIANSPCACFWCPTGDCGAAYDACGADYCGTAGGGTAVTNKRAISPTINCSGYSTITIAFNYIERGQPNTNGSLTNTDGCWLEYSTDNGASWLTLHNLGKTIICSGQGMWTAFSAALPSTCDNNPNVRIAFHWQNNGDDVGTDPSFAVDDITLTAPGSSDIFTAEYFPANPVTTFGAAKDPSLNYISTCEYWILDRQAGSAGRTVTLSWDANSCPMTALADIRVARWNGAMWKDHGNGGTTGAVPPASGTVVSGGTINTYSPFTLATITPPPLPISLVRFDAYYNSRKTVDLNWITLSEENNDFFTVERTVDGKSFTEIARIDGAGNSTNILHYRTEDLYPVNGLSYYRLRQTDFDGKSFYSKLVAVKSDTDELEILNIYGSYSLNEIYFQLANADGAAVRAEIFDAAGRVVFSQEAKPLADGTLYTLNVPALQHNMYSLRIYADENILSRKFFY